MQITLTPIRMDAILELDRAGDMLMVNGAAHDFSDIPEGGERAAEDVGCPFIAGPVRRLGGTLILTMLRPYGPEHRADPPAPVTLEPQDGAVPLPEA
ncbi:hypothetical protein SAMN04490248_12426 [Salinihabitans flavidus]|uniref:Uncharacterized protein n=1 Tax=Salinihabitans flavidus TaxID=569882 RepID=A0A1H8V287_9RHOB|nr:hypothetical protein [Salinihabitans flavidus]SEP09324.1 hypothetical protein SAMN04490248_12426 [Salinihabitans flavidus]